MRFNNRACALMDIPDLPQGAFEHCGNGKIKPQGGGGGGGIVSAITDPISSALGTDGGGGGILGAVEDVGQSIGSGLSEVDTFVNRELPGGWITPAVAAAAIAAPYAAPLLAAETGAAEAAALLDAAAAAEGGTTAGMAAAANTGLPNLATAAGAAETAAQIAQSAGQALPYTESFDAYNLAQQGLSSGQIAQNLQITANVSPSVAQYMGELAVQGLSPEQIAKEVALIPQYAGDSQYVAQDVMEQARATNVPSGSVTSWDTATKPLISPMQAIQGLSLAKGLLGGQQQQQMPQLPQMGGARSQMPQGAVDYSGLYNLLALQRARNPNSLLG